MTPLSVGINLLWLVPGDVGGSEESTVASLRALSDLTPNDLDLRLFALEPFAAAHPEVTDAFRTTLLPLSGRSRAARVGSEASWLARHTRRLDLVHHAGGTAPPMRGAPYVLTVHDLQPLEQRATHGRLKRAYLGAILPRSVHAARRIAVPSEFVRQSLLSRLDANPLRVVVIPHGVETHAAPTPIDVLSDRYQLNGRLVLYPAITYPHKNHAVLVEAFAAVVAHHPDAVLVLTGGQGAEEERVLAQVERLRLTDRVRRTGRIPVADVAGLYRAASVVAVPSRYEGFGLPAVEALTYGAPVVAAAATALPEVVGEAGVLVDPDDVDAWAAAISALLESPDERARLVEAGLVRARRYSGSANATAFADLYRGAV